MARRFTLDFRRKHFVLRDNLTHREYQVAGEKEAQQKVNELTSEDFPCHRATRLPIVVATP